MSKTSFKFADGKYWLVRDDLTYTLEAFRNGEPWGRDFVGDNLINSMLNEIESLKAEIQHLREYEYMYKELCDE